MRVSQRSLREEKLLLSVGNRLFLLTTALVHLLLIVDVADHPRVHLSWRVIVLLLLLLDVLT